MTYPLGDMSITTLTNITSQLTSNIVIVPFFRGEATLNPHFVEAMNVLRRFSNVQFATNADYLTPHSQKAILDTCSFVSVSLHNYLLPHQTKLAPFFYDALGNGTETQISILDSLVASKKRKSRFVNEWLNHVGRVRIYQTHSFNGFGDMQECTPPTTPCDKPFEEMVVYWDGRVGLCNHDWNNQTPLGDLAIQKISDVWNNAPYEEVRTLHSNGQRGSVATCKDCCFEPNHIYGELIKHG